jgi:hypothetical protein
MSDEGGLPSRRRDELSDWHDLESAACPDCGCTYYFAKDEPEIVWEPERAWGEECRDRDCHCHTTPIIGRRRSDGPGDDIS